MVMLGFSLALAGCGDSSNNSRQNRITKNPNPELPSPFAPVGTLPQTPCSNCYKIPIIAHGGQGIGNLDLWHSWRDETKNRINQEILRTDKRFKLRVKALPAPSRGTLDGLGKKCSYDPVGYKVLGVEVKVMARENGTRGESHIFRGIRVGEVSEIYSYRVPATNHPLMIGVKNAEWDYSCEYYKRQGFGGSEHGVSSYCPYSAIWRNDCFQIELQFVTDHTQDF